MVSVDLLVTEVEFGVHLIEDEPGLTLILFIAFSLLAIIGSRFWYYAHKNHQATEIQTQQAIWVYMRYIGLLATAYGGVGVAQIVTSLDFAAMNAVLLATTLVIAFTIRQIHFAGPGAPPTPLERLIRAGFLALVFVYAIAVYTTPIRLAAGIEGLSALAFLLYGATFFEDQTADARLQGTLLDSLLRHLMPVLAFAALVGITALATAMGLAPVVVWHVQVVLIIMTGTALMTGTIKLRQNLAGL